MGKGVIKCNLKENPKDEIPSIDKKSYDYDILIEFSIYKYIYLWRNFVNTQCIESQKMKNSYENLNHNKKWSI